jgi:hypothetical protein
VEEHIRQLVFPDVFGDHNDERRSVVALKNAWNADVQRQVEELGISGSTGERFGAYLALARVTHDADVPYFVERLYDEMRRAGSEDGDACGWLCGILHDLGAREAARVIEQVLITSPCGSTRHTAALALGACGDRESLKVLENAAQNDSGADYEGRSIADAARAAFSQLLSNLPGT